MELVPKEGNESSWPTCVSGGASEGGGGGGGGGGRARGGGGPGGAGGGRARAAGAVRAGGGRGGRSAVPRRRRALGRARGAEAAAAAGTQGRAGPGAQQGRRQRQRQRRRRRHRRPGAGAGEGRQDRAGASLPRCPHGLCHLSRGFFPVAWGTQRPRLKPELGQGGPGVRGVSGDLERALGSGRGAGRGRANFPELGAFRARGPPLACSPRYHPPPAPGFPLSIR